MAGGMALEVVEMERECVTRLPAHEGCQEQSGVVECSQTEAP
jgi:hypothetical protein